MALRITRKPTDYISETAFMYDVAQTSKYFDKSVYQGLSALGDQDGVKQYLYGLAGYKDKDATAFNQTDYDYLQSPEDKASYVLYKLSGETDADTDAYFEYKIQEAIDKRTYESLNWFEKTTATVGGILGNVLNETLLGTTEGLIDTLALGFGTTAKLFTGDDAGAKQFMTKDITGVAENRADLQKFARKYTYIDKNGFTKGVNDVAVALGQMLPLALNIVAPGTGTVVYTSAMAGNAAANAVEANPDIDYLALNGYYFGMVGLSLATGKISQKILGGSGNLIDDLMYGSSKTATTKIGEFASKNLATKLGFSFLSEGLEESIEEFADVVLYNTLVAKNDLTLEQEYSIKEILYAGLIGGLVGGLADSVGIAFTKKSVLTEDGRIMTKAEAEKLNLKVAKELSKFETLSFNDRIQQAQALLETNLDARADLLTKYPDLTEAQIQEQHYTEYMEALEKNEQIKSKANEVILGLSKILDLVGEESFIKAVDLANTTLETQQRLMDDYVAKATGKTAKHVEIAEKFKKQYPTSSITISDTPTAQQKRLIQNMKNAYGIDVYFGTIGEKNGRAINYAVTLDENTIVIDEKQASNLSEQALLNEVVKEELVHTIQFTKNLITPRLLAEIQYAMGNTEFAKQTLNAGYDLDTPLNQISEAQAKAVAQVLLFDNLTVSKMFYTQYSTLNSVYKKFLDIKNWLLEAKELRSQKGKMKFNMLLKSMKMYRDIAAEKLGTAENVEQFIKDYQLTELEQKQLRDAYLENPEIGPIEGYAEEAYSKQEQQSQEISELLYNEDGTPKTFYKGGNTKGITEFNALAGEKYITSDKTAWVSDSLAVSKSYSNEKQPDATIYSLDLTQISNPKIIDAKGAFWNNIDGKTTNQLVDEAIAENKGYDAVIIKNVIDPGTYSTDRALANPATSVAVIDPSKIKIVSESPRNEAGVEKQHATLTIENGETTDLKSEKQNVRDLLTDKKTGQLRLFEMSPEQKKKYQKTIRDRYNTKNTTAMENVLIDELFTSSTSLADKIKNLFTLTGVSEYQGETSETKKLYFRAAKKIVSENAALFIQITPKNYYEIRKALIADGDEQARVAVEMIDEYARIHKHKFAVIEQQIEKTHHEEITSAARRMGLWSSTLKEAAPISSFVDGLRSEGVDYNVSDKKLYEILAKHNDNLKKPDKYLIELKSNHDALTKELEVMAEEENPSPERQVEISADLVKLDNEIFTLENGSALEIIDYYVNHADSLTQKHDIQQEAFEAIFESAIELDEDVKTELETNEKRNKQYKDYPELFPNLNKKIKKIASAMEHFRITAMLSSPITWVRNAINNRLLYGLAKVTDFIEGKINETAKFQKLYSHAGQYKLVTSASEKAEYKQTKTYLTDTYYDYIFSWLGSSQNKMDTSSVSAEIARTKSKVQQKTGNAIAKSIGKIEDIIYKNLETGKLGDRPMTTKYMLESMANILTANKDKYVASINALYGDADRINRSKSLSDEQKKKLITALDTQTPIDLFEAVSILPEVFEDFLQTSSARALETFLKNDTAFSRLLRNVSQQNIFAKVAIGIINPFYKVGGNVLAMAWKYSPMNFINAIGKLKRAEMVTSDGYVGKYTGTETAEASRAFAQASVGSALWIAGIIAAALGWVDIDEDEYMGPYVNAFGVKIGLSELAPAMTTFSTGAVMMKSWKDGKIFDMDQFLRVMYSNTLLGTVENVFKYRSEMDFFSSLSINYLTAYIPAIFKLTAKIFDDGVKDKSGNWMSKLWKSILASLPGASRAVPNKINQYTGETQKRYGAGNFIENLIGAISPVEISFETKNMSEFEKEATALGAETTGMSGSFTINDTDYKLTGKDKEKYAKYKAQYINKRFESIVSGKEKVTIKDEKTGKYKTVKYESLNKDEKQRVLKNLYTTGTTITKIRYWLDKGNSYIVTDRDQYYEYKKLFGNSANIVYKNKWSTSKFVEG